MFVHLAVHLLFTRLSSGVAADQSISAKEESFMRARLSKWRVVTSGGVAQFNARAPVAEDP